MNKVATCPACGSEDVRADWDHPDDPTTCQHCGYTSHPEIFIHGGDAEMVEAMRLNHENR